MNLSLKDSKIISAYIKIPISGDFNRIVNYISLYQDTTH